MDSAVEETDHPTSAYHTDASGSVASINDAILPRRRNATLYDAVAGKVKTNDKKDRDRSRSRSPITKYSTGNRPLAPEEVLFRRRAAPQRYAEHDIYLASQRDLPRGVLPDGDLVKAIHGFSSRYYGALDRRESRGIPEGGLGGRPGGEAQSIDERSMDETALLAFGILMEEAGREVLGKRGDLVFTEAAEPEEVERETGEAESGIAIGCHVSGMKLAHRRKRHKADSGPADD